jgi:hypothetical protein
MRFLVSLDESKGTGTGYDTGYISATPARMDQDSLDVSQATRFPLVRDGDALRSDPDSPATFDVLLGPAGSQVQKPVSVEFEVWVQPAGGPNSQPGNEPEVRMQARLALHGGWYGALKTDAGDVLVQPVDRNHNGVFGERAVKLGGNTNREQADAVSFPEVTGPCALGKAVRFQGQLYSVEVTPCGDTIRVSPFEGETGVVRFSVKDGRGRPTRYEYATLSGEGGSFRVDPGPDPRIPAGSYVCEFAAILPISAASSGNESGLTGLTVKPGGPVVVAPNKTVTVSLGGPISLDILGQPNTIEIRRGSTKRIEMILALKNGKVLGTSSRRGRQRVEVMVKDRRGNEVFKSPARAGWAAHWTCEVRIPAGCASGVYKIVARFDARPYQPPLQAVKTLRVVD